MTVQPIHLVLENAPTSVMPWWAPSSRTHAAHSVRDHSFCALPGIVLANHRPGGHLAMVAKARKCHPMLPVMRFGVVPAQVLLDPAREPSKDVGAVFPVVAGPNE